jgi:hypothetical protein
MLTLVGGATASTGPEGALVAGTVVINGMLTLMGRATPSDGPVGALVAGTVESSGMDTLTGCATPSCEPAPGPLVVGTVVMTGRKTLTGRAVSNVGTGGATVTVTAPLWAVPTALVTENVYVPGGTVEGTVRLIGRLCSVAPERIVAERLGLEKLTARILTRLIPAIWTCVVTP